MILKNVIHDSKRHDQYLFKCNPPAYDRNGTNTIKNIQLQIKKYFALLFTIGI